MKFLVVLRKLVTHQVPGPPVKAPRTPWGSQDHQLRTAGLDEQSESLNFRPRSSNPRGISSSGLVRRVLVCGSVRRTLWLLPNCRPDELIPTRETLLTIRTDKAKSPLYLGPAGWLAGWLAKSVLAKTIEFQTET